MTSPSHVPADDQSKSPPHPSPHPPFPFFSLPPELRSQILRHALQTTTTTSPPNHQPIDLDPANHPSAPHRLALFLASRQLHDESSTAYYSSHTFRIFPTHHRFLNVRPLIARLPTRYRAVIRVLELRLGPGWSNPPRSWRVDDGGGPGLGLGLEEMEAVRTVRVFVECDPSHEVFDGFRIDREFFTGFSGGLLEGVLGRLPAVGRVELDGWPSVKREGPLVKRLLEVARNAGVRVLEVGGNGGDDEDEDVSIYRARRRLNYPVELD